MSLFWHTCPHCRIYTQLDDASDLSQARCQSCGGLLIVPAAVVSEPEWYFIRAKQKIGPVSQAELRAQAGAGQLQPTDMVLQAGTTKWVPASSVAGLFPTEAAPMAITVAEAVTSVVQTTVLPSMGKFVGFMKGVAEKVTPATQAASQATLPKVGKFVEFMKGMAEKVAVATAAPPPTAPHPFERGGGEGAAVMPQAEAVVVAVPPAPSSPETDSPVPTPEAAAPMTTDEPADLPAPFVASSFEPTPEASTELPHPVAIPITGWYYAHNKLKVGPVSLEELREMSAAGRLRAGDMLMEQGKSKWVPASSVADLFPGVRKTEEPAAVPTPSVEPSKPLAPATPPPEPSKPASPPTLPVETISALVTPSEPSDMPAPPAPAMEPSRVEPAPVQATEPPPTPAWEAPPEPSPASSLLEPVPDALEPPLVPATPPWEPVLQASIPEPVPVTIEPPPLAASIVPANPEWIFEETPPADVPQAISVNEPITQAEVREISVQTPLPVAIPVPVPEPPPPARPPGLDDHLPRGPEGRKLLLARVRADLEKRHEAGDLVRIDSYLERYADLAMDRKIVLGLIEAEYGCRRWREPDLKPEDYVRRFPNHADEILARLQPPMSAPVTPPLPPEQDEDLPHLPGYQVLGMLRRGPRTPPSSPSKVGVYKARHEKLQRLVALKVLTAGTNATPYTRERFLAEARALARVQHPNLVQIYEVGEHEGQPYLALEYADGGTLADKLAGLPQPPHAAAEMIEALADALHAAHRHNVFHRDLNTANILLASFVPGSLSSGPATKDQEQRQIPKIANLGLSRCVAEFVNADKPKDGANEDGIANDIHALGAILYELLTGRAPLSPPIRTEAPESAQPSPPVPPSWLQPDVPRDLETICLKCLDPVRRYASAQTLAADLRLFLAGKPVVSFRENVILWCRRQPMVAALVAITVLSLIWLVTSTRSQSRNVKALRLQVEQELEATKTLLRDSEQQGLALAQAEQNARASKARADRAEKVQRLALFDQKAPEAELEYRLLRLAVLNTPEYRQGGADLIKRFGQYLNPESVYAVLWTSVVGNDPLLAPAQVEELVQTLVERNPKSAPSFLVLRGAALYRAGRYDAARERLDEALAARPEPPGAAWLFLAMTHSRLQRPADARAWFDKACQWLDAHAQEGSVSQRQQLTLLRLEAARLLKKE